MRHSPVVLVALCCALLSGCQAARPLPSAKHPITNTGRQLLSVNWGAFTCAGMDNIGFSTSYKALAHDGVIMGNVRIHNRGDEPFLFNTPGFRLMGLGGYMDSQMKCPDTQVPAGGMLQCGFVAPAIESLAFDSFRPFFVREASTTPCFCQQPYAIDSFALPAEANFAMSLNDNDIDDDDDHDDNDDDNDDKKIVRISHDDGVHGTSVHVNLSEDLNNLVKPWLGFADAVAEAFGDSAKALSQALSKTVPDALSLADEVANSIFSVRVGPIGFITEDPRQPLQTIPRAHSVSAPKQPTQPTPKAVDSVTSVTAPKADSVTAPKTDSAVAPSSPQGPSTGTDSKVSTPSDKADASATPAKEAPQAAKDTPILTEPVASKAPVVEAPVADKKETVVTAPTTPSKPVDAVSTPTDAPVVTRPTPTTTPTPTSDKQEVKDSKTQTPAVDVPKPTADNKDQKALPVAETPATQAPTAVTPAPKAEDTPAEVITPKGPVDAPKSSEPAITTPVSKPATEAKKDSAPAEKPAFAAPLPTEDKTTTGPAITPKPAADSNKQDSTPVEKPAVVPTPAKTPIDKPATVTPTDAPTSTGPAVDKAADSAPKTAEKPVAEKPAGEAVKPSEADKVSDKPVRSAYRVASIY